MEVKIPKEIRRFTESIFMGLNLRQCIMSLIAIALAIPIFLWLRPSIGLEGASWVCVIIVAPIGATAFVKIKNLPLLDFVIAFVKWFMTRNPLVSQPSNLYKDTVSQMRLTNARKVQKRSRFKRKSLLEYEEDIDEPNETDC